MQAETGAPLITSPHTDDPSSTPTTPTAAPSTRRRSLYAALAAVAALILATDRITKAWAEASLVEGESRELIGSVLRLTLTRNPGAAFSVGTGATWVFTLIAAGVAVAILVASRRLGSTAWAVALGLLLGGCLGNLTDRLTEPPGFGRGHVIDFLQLPNWPIFNIADSAVVTAALLIALLTLRGKQLDGGRAQHGPPEQTRDAPSNATGHAAYDPAHPSQVNAPNPAQTERDA